MAIAFNARRAAQVVGYLTFKDPTRRLNILKAVKLVYLADKESLARFGWPILDDDYRVSMPHGPVNSMTYRFLNGEMEDEGWSKILRDRSNHLVSLKPGAERCGWDELSEADIECLDRVWDKFGHMDQWQLVDFTHNKKNVPEWEDPSGSSDPIPLSRILHMLKVEGAEELEQMNEDHKKIGAVFKSLR